MDIQMTKSSKYMFIVLPFFRIVGIIKASVTRNLYLKYHKTNLLILLNYQKLMKQKNKSLMKFGPKFNLKFFAMILHIFK